jgi:hypothetical protein
VRGSDELVFRFLLRLEDGEAAVAAGRLRDLPAASLPGSTV